MHGRKNIKLHRETVFWPGVEPGTSQYTLEALLLRSAVETNLFDTFQVFGYQEGVFQLRLVMLLIDISPSSLALI